MTSPEHSILERLRGSRDLWADFQAICHFGGRFVGSESEKAAVDWLKSRVAALTGQAPEPFAVAYDGWHRVSQRLERLTPKPELLDCHALVWSPSTPAGGLEAEVVDLGRGTLEEIEKRGDEIRGRIPLVRHEYMFATDTVHRRRKYDAARAAGAIGFLIASHLPGRLLVTGSSGRHRPEDVPAAGITLESANALAPADGQLPRVRLSIETGQREATAESLILDMPGQTPEWVVLSAHIDGHPLGQSAMDNATGLAVVLSVAAALAPHMPAMTRGLRLCLFNLEEWGLAGSAEYLDRMPADDRAAIALNINLDSVGGDRTLTALTSEFPKLESFLRDAASDVGVDLGFHLPTMRNSDHYNFARHGIPAFRLVAGFNDRESALRYVLTPSDTVAAVHQDELETAALLTAAVALRACSAPTLDLRPGGPAD
ncbi:MAG: M28 family peptidase [Alphaproteobacteria bacterium]|nr:M28 family peptidase [Alphaproteobacteria bacterium]